LEASDGDEGILQRLRERLVIVAAIKHLDPVRGIVVKIIQPKPKNGS
jgi:hypothetical protein